MDRVLLCKRATWLRSSAKLTQPSYSTRAIIAACFPDLRVTGRELPDGVDELVSRQARLLIYQRTLPVPNQRFAIAHGLGHLMFDGDDQACRPEHRSNVEIEERADWFAAELLMPLAELSPRLTRKPSTDRAQQEFFLDHVDELSSDFRVPSQIVRWRIDELLLFGVPAA